jgi:hypothetical protein
LDSRRKNSGATSRKPTTYLTTEELQQIAAEKFEEAAALPPGPDQQKLLISANGFRHAADVRSWLASESRPPK